MPTSLRASQKRVLFLVGLLAVAGTAGCGDDPAPSSPAPSTFSVVPQPLVGGNTLTAVRDTTLVGGFLDDLNLGAFPFLLVEKSLIAFDQGALTAIAPAGMKITAGRLEVTVVGNPVPPGRPRTIKLFRMTRSWVEDQATWRCAADTNLWNLRSNCAPGTQWFVATPPPVGKTNPWAATPSATAQLPSGATGVLSFDVTADVKAFASGALPNHGWMMKSDDLDGGFLILASRETSAPPHLVVTTDCGSGYADCDGNPANGCEQRLNTPTSCGGCGLSCNDGNACTADACSEGGSCTHAAVHNGLACNDGNACTQVDSCQAGVCTGGSPIACAASDQCHAAGSCNPQTGACSDPAAADGTACNDLNPCSQTDLCVAGVCTGANQITCAASDQCHAAGVCDSATGACTNPPAHDGTACNDDNGCTQNDRCLAGACAASDPVVCPSTDGCHPGVCNAPGGACTTVVACHLYGVGTVLSSDQDGLAVSPQKLEGGTSNNQVGGIGSAIAYTGVGNLFLTAPDRGPNAGEDSYTQRYYVIDMGIGDGKVLPKLKAGAVLDQGVGLPTFTGRNTAFDATNSPAGRRLDVEGLRAGPGGTFFVSDEYGPFLYEFSADGHRLRSFDIPAKFLIDHPAVEDDELPPKNSKGRQANAGMEGLAISPDGSKLFGLMQRPLIQDGALSNKNNRIGTNLRLLEIDVASGQTRELLYPIDDPSLGTNEILAINDHQFLVDERDGKDGNGATVKKLFLIDISGATDISNIPALPSTAIPAGVTPVAKKLFLDLLDPAFGLAGASFPEKIEGLAFGPDLPDGRHTLVVSSDNDFLPSQDGKMFVFAIAPAALPGLVPQQVAFGNLCEGPTPVTCTAADVCHRVGMCNPGTGTCALPAEPAGKAVGDQVAGDCQRVQCDGAGNIVNASDGADVPGDGNQCTSDVCTSGVPSNPPVAAGTTCSQNGGSACDGAGACVSCLTAADCGDDTECTKFTCIAGGCGLTHVAAGTVVSTQVVGDCQLNTCDGAGGVVPNTDDADVPGDDGSPCTVETCAAGLPASVPSPAGLSCGGNGLCDGTGVCVGCLAASDCPGQDTACAQRACVVGVCQLVAAPVGTLVAAQLPGDCQRNQCDGTGQVQAVADDGDLPVDNNQCTADVCSAGVPSNSNLPSGISCAPGGGSSCDGAGQCVSSTFRVLRLGDGTVGLNNAGASVFVDERRTDGTLVGTVALPTVASGANQPFTMSGSASSEGGMSLSGDGRYLVIPGYAAIPTTATVASTTAALVKRSVARVDAAGNVDTSTMLLTAFSANNVRGATSFDGSGFWVAGAGATGGIWFVPLGTTGGVQVLATPNNIRWLQVIGTQLYGTSNQGALANVFTVGAGLPTTSGQIAAMFPGLPIQNMPPNNNPSPFGFVLLDLVPGVGNATGADTLYVADDRAAPTGGVQKWTLSGSTWVLTATLNVASTPIGFRGLAGSAAGGKVTLIGTTADNTLTRVVVFVDDGAVVTSTVVATAPANVLFRGVALSPR